MQVTRSREECVMAETAKHVNLRDQCGRIRENLNEAHRFVDELIGPEVPVDNVPGIGSQEGLGSLQEVEDLLAKINDKARRLAVRLEDLIKQV
jgi:hypothetical protein